MTSLDKIDREILALIQRDGRISNATLAERIGLSETPCATHDLAISNQFEREVQGVPRILACHNISGSADYLLEIVSSDLADYGLFVRDVLRSLPGVTSVESMLSLRDVKGRGALPIL